MATAAAAQSSDDFPTLFGHLYARWTLDCLIEIGYAISVDLITRPQLYLSDDIPDSIVDLRMSYGTNPRFPKTAQRQAMKMPIFGRSDGLKPDASTGAAQFYVARKKFIEACTAFSQGVINKTITPVAPLELGVRSALFLLRGYFEGLRGKSVQLTSQQMSEISVTVISILRAPDVAKVFSQSPANGDWPFASDDPNGAKLVETAGSQLPLPTECKLGYLKFLLLQRVALEGEPALSLALTTDPRTANEDALLALISQGYTWGRSLYDFQQAP